MHRLTLVQCEDRERCAALEAELDHLRAKSKCNVLAPLLQVKRLEDILDPANDWPEVTQGAPRRTAKMSIT